MKRIVRTGCFVFCLCLTLSVYWLTNTQTFENRDDRNFPPTLHKGKDLNPDILTYFTLDKNEGKDPYYNLHQYKFTLNASVCSDPLYVLTLIHSAPANVDKRNLIRKTFGSVKHYKQKQLGYVFLLGAVDDQKVQMSVLEEARLHGDIVQGDFKDSYKSLIRKHIMGMHWYRQTCSSDFIIKMDDDVFINPFRFVDYITKTNISKDSIHCNLSPYESPIRNVKSKWYTPPEQYPFSLFPEFCHGMAYLTTPETWNALYRASEKIRGMDMDDVYVSSILAMRADVRRVHLGNWLIKCPWFKLFVNENVLDNLLVFDDEHQRCGDLPFQFWDGVAAKNVEPTIIS